MTKSIWIFLTLLVFSFSTEARADNLRLYNGREFVGLVREVNDQTVTLDIGIGVVKFRRWEVKDIERWNDAENEDLKMRWAKKRIKDEARAEPILRTPEHHGAV